MAQFIVTIQIPGQEPQGVVVEAANAGDAQLAASATYPIPGASFMAQPVTSDPQTAAALQQAGAVIQAADVPAVRDRQRQTDVPFDQPRTLEQPNTTRDSQLDLEFAFPEAAFNRGLEQAGYNQEGPLGGLLRRQYAPARANFTFDRYLRGTADDSNPESSFEAYAAKGPSAYSNAQNIFGQIAGGAPFADPEIGGFLRNAGAGDYAEDNPQGVRARNYRNQLQTVARSAARGKYGLASQLGPSPDELERRFEKRLYEEGQRGPSAQGVNAIDFYKRYFAL